MTEEKYGDSYGEKFRQYEDKIKELEKENAELKEKVGNYQKGMFDEIAVHIKDAVMAGYNICKSECEKSDLENAIRIGALEEENTKLKLDIKTAYVKGIRHMAKALKDYDRTEGAWTDYFEHTVDKVLKKKLGEVDNEKQTS